MEDAQGSTPLFGVFLLSLISLVLVPYTLNSLFGSDDDDKEVVKTWSSSKKDRKRPSLSTRVMTRLRSTFTPRMLAIWAVYLLLLLYVKSAAKPMDRFDPFTILGVTESATDAEIKRAYRKLSLQYHPDKNPDPKATTYFAEYITKAYKSLTDETSRENYKKYGHPDGPQAVSISVALPEWFFNKDKEAAPAILLVLLLGGIVLPLGLSAWYMGKSQNLHGPNEVFMETVGWYCHPKFGIKARQGCARLPETFVIAREFLELPFTPRDQGPALVELRAQLNQAYPELTDREKAREFYDKRNPKIVKAHMLLLAHLARIPVAAPLRKDMAYLLEKAPRLLQEMFSASMRSVFDQGLPRIRPHYGWLMPAVGTVELMQCLIQAVPPEERKKTAGLPAKSSESPAALMQLPHIDEDVVRQLTKKGVKSLTLLQNKDKIQRRVALQGSGLTGADADDVEVALSALPSVFVAARIDIDDGNGAAGAHGAGSIDEAWAGQDVVTVTAWSMLLRPSHQAPGFDSNSLNKVQAVRAYAPHFPHPRDEHWFFMVADPATGALLAWQRVSLVEAEGAGAKYAANWTSKATVGGLNVGLGGGGATGALLLPQSNNNNGNSTDDASTAELVEKLGQRIELQFIAPQAGKHELVLYVMPDSWLGADRSVNLGKLKTVEPTRAQREGREGRTGTAIVPTKRGNAKTLQRSEESEALLGGGDSDGGVGDDGVNYNGNGGEIEEDYDGSGSDSGGDDEDDEDEGEAEWDSDEFGSEETESENDEDGDDADDA